MPSFDIPDPNQGQHRTLLALETILLSLQECGHKLHIIKQYFPYGASDHPEFVQAQRELGATLKRVRALHDQRLNALRQATSSQTPA